MTSHQLGERDSTDTDVRLIYYLITCYDLVFL